MAKRPAHTLIFLGSQRSDRVDLGPGPGFALLAQSHESSSGSDDVALRLQAALASIPRPGRQIWILWEGASVQLLDLAGGMIEGLEGDDLANALSFEAEPLTGIPATDSAIDGVLEKGAGGVASEMKRYWVTQIPASLRTKLEGIVRRGGSSLGGIAHPGGLPRSGWDGALPAAQPAGHWRRIELWDPLTFSVYGMPGGAVETRIIRSSPGSDEWLSALPREGPLSWMGPGPVVRVDPGGHLVPGAVAPVGEDGLPLHVDKVSLPDDSAPVAWLRAWAAELTAPIRRVPVVGSAHRVSPNRKFYAAAILATSLTLAVCLFQGQAIMAQTAEARTKADHLETLRKQMSPDTKGQEAAIIAEAAKLQEQLKEPEQRLSALGSEVTREQTVAQARALRQSHFEELWAIHRPAVAELLGALGDAEQRGAAKVFVKEVRQDGSDLRLTGVCKHAADANQFANDLAGRLGKSGWRVAAAQKRLREDDAFDFAVVLTPVVLGDASDLPKPTTRPSRNLADDAKRDRSAAAVPVGGRS